MRTAVDLAIPRYPVRAQWLVRATSPEDGRLAYRGASYGIEIGLLIEYPKLPRWPAPDGVARGTGHYSSGLSPDVAAVFQNLERRGEG